VREFAGGRGDCIVSDVIRSVGPGCKVVALAAFILVSCSKPEEQAGAPPPPAVSVMAVQKKDVTPATEFVGRVVAIDKVELRARVQGFLQKRLFTEGQDVKAGDLLFVIEPEPFQAAVTQAEADLASAEADAQNAKLQLGRAEELVRKQNIPVATRDDRAAAAAMANARVQEKQASLQVAKINLTYTEIRAPVAGRIGLAKYTEGNLVGPDSGTIATLVSQDPIYVTFQVTQREILEAQRRMAAAGTDVGSLVVRLKLPDGSDYDHPGKVNFLDVQVDQGTDTATVRAEFPNAERLLVDGAFVNVSVERGTPTPSLVIPQSALQVDQAGPFALVVNNEKKVEVRRLTIGRAAGTDMTVEKGLNEGDLVIVEGIQKVRPGAVVEPTTVPPSTVTPAASAG
jgi:membrane fusion protein, multidrug efflux system